MPRSSDREVRGSAEQARDDDRVEETQSLAEEAEGETCVERKKPRPDKATQAHYTS